LVRPGTERRYDRLGHQIGSGSKIDDSLLRAANADPNMTLTRALY
jgi:hypothetical protein